jgi:hypothetical protein
MNMGSPPTERNARTGLLTPPGMCFFASSNNFFDRVPAMVFLSSDAMMMNGYCMIITHDL